MPRKSKNVSRMTHQVTATDRWQKTGHKSGVLWFTGLPGSGKTTLISGLKMVLLKEGYTVCDLDNKDFRDGLSANLGFSQQDRTENIRRAGEVAALMARSGQIVLSGFISPNHQDRMTARQATGENFHEIYLNPGQKICELRDPGGLYKQARAGEIENFTGISAPYDEPLMPELTIDTGVLTVNEALEILHDYVGKVF